MIFFGEAATAVESKNDSKKKIVSETSASDVLTLFNKGPGLFRMRSSE